MINARWLRYVPTALVLAIGITGMLQGWPLTVTILGMGLVVVVVGVLRFIRLQQQTAPLRRLRDIYTRLEPATAPALVEELQADLANGPRTPETLLGLAAALAFQGDGVAAQPPAEEAVTRYEARGICRGATVPHQLLCETAYLTLFDAHMAQGHFTTAADLLAQRHPNTARANHIAVLSAWGYFIAHDHARARSMLEQVAQAAGRPLASQQIDPRYELALAYMRHQLGLDTSDDDLIAHADLLPEWSMLAQRNAANPYGERLKTVVADIRRDIFSEQTAQ